MLTFSTKDLQRAVLAILPGLFLFFTTTPAAFAQGDLLLFPKRLVFEGTQNRVQTLNLNNNGKDTATYRLSYVENRMTENGEFELIEEPDAGQKFASPYLRFFPRTITLPPRETQVVKVQLTKTGELQAGEYRSHLYFRAVPQPSAREKEKKPTSEGISISLTPVYGISIANIIRIGDPNVQVDLSNLAFEKFENSIHIVSMEFTRSGTMSSYGDIRVLHISPEGTETTVGEMKGFAVYTPGNLRKARMELKSIEGVDYSTGKLKVIYTSQGNTKTTYAKADLQL